jgi:hypothetical protein
VEERVVSLAEREGVAREETRNVLTLRRKRWTESYGIETTYVKKQ